MVLHGGELGSQPTHCSFHKACTLLTALGNYRNSGEASKDGNRAQSILNRTEKEMLVIQAKRQESLLLVMSN